MKKLLILLSILFIVGCGNNPTKSSPSIVGVWEGIEGTYTDGTTTVTTTYDENNSVIWILGEDGIISSTRVSEGETEHNSATYSATNGKFTIIDGEDTEIFDYILSDNILTLINEEIVENITLNWEVKFQRQ